MMTAAKMRARSARLPCPANQPAAPKQWWLYVLRCGDGSLYCGITNDLVRRLAQHRAGTGARYTRGRGPLEMLRTWPHESMSAALKAELAFKTLSRAAKERQLGINTDGSAEN
jgi:putative endonuclease